VTNRMEYKGYYARIEYRDEDACFVGILDDIADVVSFEGKSVDELKTAFAEAVEDYLDICKRRIKKPF